MIGRGKFGEHFQPIDHLHLWVVGFWSTQRSCTQRWSIIRSLPLSHVLKADSHYIFCLKIHDRSSHTTLSAYLQLRTLQGTSVSVCDALTLGHWKWNRSHIWAFSVNMEGFPELQKLGIVGSHLYEKVGSTGNFHQDIFGFCTALHHS